MMELFWWVCAVVLIIEGIGPLLFPNRWRSYLATLARQRIESLRQLGLILVVSGLVILWCLLS